MIFGHLSVTALERNCFVLFFFLVLITIYGYRGAFQVALVVTNLLPMQETWVQSLGQEDPPEEEMATNSSVLTWKIDSGACGLHTVHGVRHN